MKKPPVPSKKIRPNTPTFGMGANIKKPGFVTNQSNQLKRAEIIKDATPRPAPQLNLNRPYHIPLPNPSWNFSYSIRYVVIDPSKIINMCGPDYNYIPQGWTEEQIQIQKIREQQYINHMNKEISFFTNLEQSIEKHGVLNPVLLTTGLPQFRDITHMSPEEQKTPPNKMIICELIGGSRVYIAKKLDIFIPAIVCDFANMFPSALQLYNENDVKAQFNNPPDYIQITEKGVRMDAPDQIHLNQHDKKKLPEVRRNFFHKPL